MPGSAYESIDYVFYVDANGNHNFDPGELNDTFIIPSGSFKNLAFVENVIISDGNNPTLTWDGIDEYNELLYRIRIFRVAGDNNPDKSDLLFESEFLAPVSSNSFSYTYTGDLFSENEKLSFTIEAMEVIDGRIMYQSRYFINHTAGSAPPLHQGVARPYAASDGLIENKIYTMWVGPRLCYFHGILRLCFNNIAILFISASCR